MKQLQQGDTIQIIARRWFEKVNGNTYHSMEVYVNNELIKREDFDYGYGNHYTQCARVALDKVYDLGLEKYQALSRLNDRGIKVLDSVTDVQRKKDL